MTSMNFFDPTLCTIRDATTAEVERSSSPSIFDKGESGECKS